MAIADSDKRMIEAWCEGRVPSQHLDQMRVVCRFRGNSATIVEERPDWQGRDIPWSQLRIAKLVHDPEARSWQLFARDRNDKLLEYSNEFGVGRTLAACLAAVDEDRTCIFWG